MLHPHADRSPGRGVAITILSAALAATVACASGSPRLAYSPEALVATARARSPEIAHADIVVPYRVTPEMIDLARHVISGAQSDFEKADRLVRSLTDKDGFGLRYDAVATSTPDVTIERGYGNCLALTSIFIGLAREMGLTAYYVDASDRINDLRREEDLIVDSGHIAGGVRTESGYTLVDFDGHVSRYRTFKIIDDVTALAHYYNNLGFELIFEAQQAEIPVPWDKSLASFRMATLVRPDFTRAYNNLGVAYTNLGDLDAAAASYERAIETDPKSDAAYHNLGNLQMRRDDPAAAVVAYDKALRLRSRNPYLLYHRGVAQYRLGDLAGAEESFKRAIALEDGYIEPRNLLAQVFYQQGRVQEADELRAAVQKLLAAKR